MTGWRSGEPDAGAGYVIRGGASGFERLQVLARAHGPATSALLDRVGVPAGARCLDVGCGSGDVTLDLADRVGPAGVAVGLDMDDVKLGLARDVAAGRGLQNVRFERVHLAEWAPREAYDVVFCRFVLQHLTAPVPVLATMWGAVAPGGVLVVVDADFDGLFCHPPDDAFAAWATWYPAVLRAHGGDPTAGRRLLAHFAAAGIPEPALHLVQHAVTAGPAKQLPYLTVEATADAIVAAGIATEDELRSALAGLRNYLDHPRTLIGDARVFQVWARRPAAG